MKYFGKYHELYFQSDILLLAGVFENFLSMYLKVYERDPARFLTAPVLANLKETKVKLDLVTDIQMYYWYKKVLHQEHVTLFIDKEKLITST